MSTTIITINAEFNYNLKYCQKYNTFPPFEKIEIGHTDITNVVVVVVVVVVFPIWIFFH